MSGTAVVTLGVVGDDVAVDGRTVEEVANEAWDDAGPDANRCGTKTCSACRTRWLLSDGRVRKPPPFPSTYQGKCPRKGCGGKLKEAYPG